MTIGVMPRTFQCLPHVLPARTLPIVIPRSSTNTKAKGLLLQKDVKYWGDLRKTKKQKEGLLPNAQICQLQKQEFVLGRNSDGYVMGSFIKPVIAERSEIT